MRVFAIAQPVVVPMLVEKNIDIIFAIFLYVLLDQHSAQRLVRSHFATRIPMALCPREAERGKRMRESAVTFIGTGSWVRSTVEGDYVLTCAHLVAPVFTQQRPITADELNQLYQPWIMCEHRERMFLEGHDNQRHFRLGNVQFVSCENDLLVIRIPRATMNHYCPEHHRPLTFATRVPRPLKKVVMISWPEYWRSMTAAVGGISNRNRLIARLGEENAFGFTTTLSEVDITSEAGSSGGPLFNGEADTMGVLHGGNSRYSYFIGLPEITATLTGWGIIPPQEQ